MPKQRPDDGGLCGLTGSMGAGLEQVFAVIDGDRAMRTAVCRWMLERAYTFPAESVAEVIASSPPEDEGGRTVWLVVRDEGDALERCQDDLARAGRYLPILAYAEAPRTDRVVTVMAGGVSGYVAWRADGAGFAERMLALCGANAQRQERARLAAEARRKLVELSGREREIVDLLAEGASSKEIARDLGISNRTVEVHRANALAKLGAANAVMAARLSYAAKLGPSGSIRAASGEAEA